MKVKLISRNPSDQLHPARFLKRGLIDVNPSAQIIEGPYAGKVVPYEEYVVVEEEPTFTKKQWDTMIKTHEELLKRQCKNAEYWQVEAQKNKKISMELQRELDEIKLNQLRTEVTMMIQTWLDTEYEGEEITDIKRFADKITSYISHKLQTPQT